MSWLRVAVALCLLATLSGCSFLFVTPPPADHAQLTEVRCTARRLSPILDTLVASGSGILTLAQLTATDADTGINGISNRSARLGFGLATLTTTVVWGASAISGFATVSECREALAALEARRVAASQQTPPPAVPAALPTYYAPPPVQLQPPLPPPMPAAPPASPEAPVLLFPEPPPPPAQPAP